MKIPALAGGPSPRAGRRDDVGGLEEGNVGEAERLVLSRGPQLGEEGGGGGVAELVKERGRGCDGEGVLQGVGEAEDEWVGKGGVGPEGGEAVGGGGMVVVVVVVVAVVVVEEEGGEGGDGHSRGKVLDGMPLPSLLLLCFSSCDSRVLRGDEGTRSRTSGPYRQVKWSN